MLTLTVTRHNGQTLAQALSAHFDTAGGTIGRAGSNRLVLEDTERTVSRVHAQIVWRDGRYRLVDRGSNPALVNGTPLEPGQEVVLTDGDEVQIGGYQLQARVVEREGADERGHERVDNAGHARESKPATSDPDDPFADIFGAPSGKTDPDADKDAGLDDFFSPDRPASPDSRAPFGNPPAPLPDDFDLGLDDPAANRSIDELFGLGPNADASSDARDARGAARGIARGIDYASLGSSPMDAPLTERNTAADLDPLAALSGTVKPVVPPATMPDRGSELHSAFTPPRLRPAGQTDAQARRPAQAPWDEPELPPQRFAAQTASQSAKEPWDEPELTQQQSIAQPLDKSAQAPWDIEERSSSGLHQEPPKAHVAQETLSPTSHADTDTAADSRALLQAFLRGLDAPGVRVDALTPALMQHIGALLHEATQGTLDLLVARAATKRELRSDATMIVATNNNPLKFSPNVETALAHLLHPPTRGFMEGSAALRDAYDDLRAHQVGFVTGMRAALDGVFERFEPARIEARFTQHSMLDALFAQRARRARCWDLFVEQYTQLSSEATDDFHTLFGNAFVKAYEEQIDRLKKKP
jgi:FHA domain-containing protein